jgi:asparaginyl-tRNA synthetase
VFVHHYPAAVKAFYMKEDPKEPGYAMGCDLLATEGYGEIIGGGQREDNLEILKRKLDEHKLNEKDFTWYMDLRRYGSFPHSGFGLGIERTVAWICGLPHVRETIPFPRLYGRSYP